MKPISKQLLAGVAALFTLSTAAFSAANWSAVGTNITNDFWGGKHTFTVDAEGAPYIAYRVMKAAPTGPGAPDWAPQVVTYNSNNDSWDVIDSASLTKYGNTFPEIVTGKDGKLYLSVQNFNDEYKASLLTFNGTSWEAVGNESYSESFIRDVPKVAVASDGTAYSTYRSATGDTVVVKKLVNNEWSDLGVFDMTPGRKGSMGYLDSTVSGHIEPSVTIDANDNVILSARTHVFSMAIGNYAYSEVFKYNKETEGWYGYGTTSVAPWVGGRADSLVAMKIAAAPDGSVYAAYIDGKDMRSIYVTNSNGGDWNVVGKAISNNQYQTSTTQTPVNFDLEVAADGTPYVTMKLDVTADHSHAAPIEKDVVMKFNGTEWEVAGYEAGYTGHMVSYASGSGPVFTDVEVAPNGSIYTSFQDGSTQAIKVKKFSDAVAEWAVNVYYELGQRVVHNGKTWECKYTHTSNIAWVPGTEGLWIWEEVK